MLFGILACAFALLCVLIILLILLQKGKGSLGLGTMGGGNQMLFGGSGGQDLFQKTTWVLLAFLMMGSLGLSLMKTRSARPYALKSTQNSF